MAADVGELAGDHFARAQQGGFGGLQQGFTGHALQVVGDDAPAHRLAQVFAANGLGQVQQAVEAEAAHLFNAAGAGVERLGAGERPEVVQVLRGMAFYTHRAQQFVPLSRLGRLKGELVALAQVGLAGAHHGDVGTVAAQALDQAGAQGTAVGQHPDRPSEWNFSVGLTHRLGHRAWQVALLPDRLVEPLRQVGAFVERGFGGQGEALAGLDPMALVVELVGGQRHAQALLSTAHLGPIDRRTHAPQTAQHAQHEGLVGDLLVGVAQRIEDRLVGGARRVLAGQRGQGAAGADLEQHRVLVGQQGLQAFGETHGVAQVVDPILRIGGLLGGHPGAGDVGDQRQRGRLHGDALKEGTELFQNRLEHQRVGGDRDAHARGIDLLGCELLLQGVDGGHRARGHRELRAVERGDGQVRAHQGLELGFRQGHAEHAALGQRFKQAAAQSHQAQGVFQAEHASQVGRRVLAHAVADHGTGLQAPGHPELGLRVLHRQQTGQRHGRTLEGLRRQLFLAGGRKQQALEIGFLVAGQQGQAFIDRLAEHRLAGVQAGAHGGVLGAPPGEHKGHCAAAIGRGFGEHAFWIWIRQRLGGFCRRAADEHPAVGHGFAADLERVGGIGQRHLRMAGQVGGQRSGVGVERAGGAG